MTGDGRTADVFREWGAAYEDLDIEGAGRPYVMACAGMIFEEERYVANAIGCVPKMVAYKEFRWNFQNQPALACLWAWTGADAAKDGLVKSWAPVLANPKISFTRSESWNRSVGLGMSGAFRVTGEAKYLELIAGMLQYNNQLAGEAKEIPGRWAWDDLVGRKVLDVAYMRDYQAAYWAASHPFMAAVLEENGIVEQDVNGKEGGVGPQENRR
jgi:hypothetical protein